MTEADTCRKHVVPLLVAAGWDNDPHSIAEQRTFTDGRIIAHGGQAKRGPGKRADYLLRYTRDFPVAVVEAKAIFKKTADGLQQAKEYGMLWFNIVIRSPGKPVEPITLEQLRSFNAPMLSRNPTLHYVFGKMELAEERGLDLNSMKNRATQMGLPLPKFSWEAPYLVLTLFLSPAGAVRSLSPKLLDRLNDDERASWEFIAGRESVTSPELMEHMDFDERKAQRVLKKFQDVGLLRRMGKGPATHYEVLRP